jgi:glycosyltransferase involved in cell wall biosynthesis
MDANGTSGIAALDGRGRSLLMVGNFLSGTLVTRSVCEDLAGRLAENGWHVRTTSARLNRVFRLTDMVLAALRHQRSYQVAQVDVYSGAAFLWAETVCAVLRLLGKRYILTLHGGNLPWFAQRHPGRVRRLLRSASAVTTPSGFLFEQMKLLRADLELIPNPVDVRRYAFRLRNQPKPALIWLRAFHAIYNPSLAPRVVELLAADYPDVKLCMIGPDKGDGSLGETQAVADSLGVSGRISYPGGVPKACVGEALNRGDIFLNTTNIDNTPVSVLEAMACGLPVVSTNVGGIPYLLSHEKTGLLVPPDNPQAMATSVSRLLDEPELAARLSQNGLRKASECDWKTVLPRWERLVERVAEAGV